MAVKQRHRCGKRAFTQTHVGLPREAVKSKTSHLRNNAAPLQPRRPIESTCLPDRTSHNSVKMPPPSFVDGSAGADIDDDKNSRKRSSSNSSNGGASHGLTSPQSRPQTRTSPRRKRQKTSHRPSRPTRPYIPAASHSKIVTTLLKTHMVREAEVAKQAFERRNEPGEAGTEWATLCVEKCYGILKAKDKVSEAIEARARMMLATDGMGEYAGSRA